MSDTAKSPWARKAVDYTAKGSAIDSDQFDLNAQFTLWHANYCLAQAIFGQGNAADFLSKLKPEQISEPLVESLRQQVVAELEAIDLFIANVDYVRLRTDTVYCGSLVEFCKVVAKSKEALCALVDVGAKLVSACSQRTVAQAKRSEFAATDRPKQRYAVAKENFRHGERNEAHFAAGQHCLITMENEKGIRVGSGDLNVFIPAADVPKYFDIVEI